MNPHIGSDFDDFLAEEGFHQEVEAAAMNKVIACLIAQTMADTLTEAEMARCINTSRAQLDSL
ncbi:hypothetical protein [Methylovulum psychrotolerans]|uniref:HigA2-like helix-turn-helix domain-containing protein n=1 Tax=Methylovulum psychrotolerans TaxID=1704499 RepID=A0A2S5CR01_9GAMM|nr:hypothetical protein [Methylovulum psychrotolerans]POZ53218.1 hypothetical protein AADEFJLK_00236 [Methylovulum psychrotolerans]